MTHEKIEILNYDSRVHSEHVFRLDGPQAYKNAFTVNSAITGNEKIFRFGPILARFCMGILVTLSLSKKKAPIAKSWSKSLHSVRWKWNILAR